MKYKKLLIGGILAVGFVFIFGIVCVALAMKHPEIMKPYYDEQNRLKAEAAESGQQKAPSPSAFGLKTNITIIKLTTAWQGLDISGGYSKQRILWTHGKCWFRLNQNSANVRLVPPGGKIKLDDNDRFIEFVCEAGGKGEVEFTTITF